MLAIASRRWGVSRLGRRWAFRNLGALLCSAVALGILIPGTVFAAAPESHKGSHEGVIDDEQETPHPHSVRPYKPVQRVDGTVDGKKVKVTPVPVEHDDKWFDDHFLTGDWFGYRKKAIDHGVNFTATTATDLLANVTGGFSQGFEPMVSTGVGVNLDLEKLVGWEGGIFDISMIWRAGNNLSATRIGNLLTVAQLYGGQNIRLYTLYYKQKLFEDQFYFKIGRFGAFDDFLTTPINWNFINNGFDGNPKGIFFNVPAFGLTVYPTSSWGALFGYQPQGEEWYIQSGVYSISERNGSNASNGLNFGFDADRGVAWLTQGGVKLNQTPGDVGLPGKHSLGAFYNSYKAETYSMTPETEWGLYGFYLMSEQMIYREPGLENRLKQPSTWGYDAQEGLTVFSILVVSPDDTVSFMPVFLNSGLTYQGPIPGRPQDFVAAGATVGIISEELSDLQRATGAPVQDYEMVLELNYRINLTPYFYIQPGLQYVINPNASGVSSKGQNLPDALVMGAQIGVVY